MIEELGLASCADTMIGGETLRGVSGGQAKRVNIGVELITNPRVLFLDEPTTYPISIYVCVYICMCLVQMIA